MKYGLRALALASLAALALLFAACPPAVPNPGSSSTPGSTATPTPLTDSQAVAAAKAALAIGYQSGDSAASVTKNLSLASSGANSVSVAWGTDDAVHVSAAGTVTRPAIGQPNAPVVLTATLSRGTATDTKDFNLSIMARTMGSFVVDRDWTNFGSLAAPDVTAAARDGSHIYAGTLNAGLAYSDDGGADWSVLTASDGLSNDQVTDVLASGTYVIVATFQGLTIWNRAPGSEAITVLFGSNKINDMCIDGGYLFIAVENGTNRLYHWQLSDPGMTFTGHQNPTFENIDRLHVDSGNVFAVGDSDSVHPQELNTYVNNSATLSGSFDVVAGATSLVGPVYAEGSRVIIAVNNSMYYAPNAAIPFMQATPAASGTITGITPYENALVSVRYGSDLWYSLDSGESWENVAVPGHDGAIGILANAVSVDGNQILIPYFGGLVIGHFE